jgi:hypothetical protein
MLKGFVTGCQGRAPPAGGAVVLATPIDRQEIGIT